MAPKPKADPDKADERVQQDDPFAGFELKRRADAPIFPEPARKDNAGKGAAKAPDVNARITGAYQLGGAWYAADGSPLTPPEIQQAHRAADAVAAEAKRKALLGGNQ